MLLMASLSEANDAVKGLAKQCDPGMGGLLADLKQRGLLDQTLVVWGGEFGRTVYSQGALTPTDYGRDHHPRCYSIWIAGAGVKGGQVIGETDDFSYNVVENPVHVRDLHATALRRDQSPTRANLQEIEPFKLPGGKSIDKISPLAGWTNRDVWAYLTQHNIPTLSLYDQGYTSIGCAPCTLLPIDPNNPRSGRWQGKDKLECGIHIQAE